MSSKHTPGPWKAHKPERQFDPDSDVYEIHWSDIGECVAEIVHGEANARLIAAAPELLEACKAIIDAANGKGGQTYYNAIWLARAAVAKAEGEA